MKNVRRYQPSMIPLLRNLILCVLCAFAAKPHCGQAEASPARTLPNIVLFLVDDMGLMDTSAPMLADKNGKPQRHPLNDWYRTPNMERLAKMGMRFKQLLLAQRLLTDTRLDHERTELRAASDHRLHLSLAEQPRDRQQTVSAGRLSAGSSGMELARSAKGRCDPAPAVAANRLHHHPCGQGTLCAGPERGRKPAEPRLRRECRRHLHRRTRFLLRQKRLREKAARTNTPARCPTWTNTMARTSSLPKP